MTQTRLFVYQKVLDIAWGDMDALGHVNNVRYFEYFQQARIEWLSRLSETLAGEEGPVIIHTSCTFLKPVVYPARVAIDCYLHSLGRSSLVVDHDLYQEGELMAQGVCKLVWVDYKQSKAIPVPESIRNLFDLPKND